MSFLDDLIGKDAATNVGQLIEQFESGNAHEVAPEQAADHHGDPSSSEALGKLFGALQGTPGGMTSLLSTDGAKTLFENQAFRSALVGVGAMAAKKLL